MEGNFVPKITIDKNLCKGCGLCVTVCPKGILKLSENELNDKGYSPVEITDMESCTACASCAKMCPDVVFTIEK
jgi:2-oxoglutarate ferredoxin oxidoreductase subunit delta